MEDKIYKPQDNITNPYIKDFDEYKSMYEESILNPEKLFAQIDITLYHVKIEEFLQHIYPNEHNKNSERINNKKLVEKLFFDRNGNFKISSISKLF